MTDATESPLRRARAAPLTGRKTGKKTGENSGKNVRRNTVTALVALAQQGDEDAFLALYQAVAPRLLNYLRTLVGANDAEDVCSETWARIVADLHTYRPDRSSFLAWSTTIARYRAIDHLRRANRASPRPHHLLPEGLAADDTPADAAEHLSTTWVLDLLTELPPSQAQAVLLRVVMGMDAPTAGQIMGKRPGAVRVAVHRGLRALEARLTRQACA